MRVQPQLAAILYLETSANTATPLLSANTALPTIWNGPFSTVRDEQTFIDVHLLYGTSTQASCNTSIGRWRIHGIPPSTKGQPNISICVHVDTSGQVGVTATLKDRPLPVSHLSATIGRVPVGAAEMPTDALYAIRQRLEVGDREGARGELAEVLRADPRNTPAWELLATLLEDPAKQADCYRQILRIAPNNRHAAAKLKALIDQTQEPTFQEQLPHNKAATLQCKHCGANMEVRFVGEWNDKRAVCPHCNAEEDLPDTFRRVEQKRLHEKKPGSSRTLESMFMETRSDHLPGDQSQGVVPEIEDVPKVVQWSLLSQLRSESPGWLMRARRRSETEIGNRDGQEIRPLSADEIIELAGGAMSPEESRICPKCEAVISRKETRCPWCSTPLTDALEQ
jgi:hypothetical protein